MKIEVIKVGELQCNCYILEKRKNILIIDPGDDFDLIKRKIGNRNPLAILVTHNHQDHIGALEELKKEYNINSYDHYNLEEGEYSIDKFDFEVIYTPGHTSDSISFKFGNDMFVGDFIFRDSIGRCDLPTGDFNIMKKSLEKIKKMDNNINIYPGHYISTTLKDEKELNPFFKN